MGLLGDSSSRSLSVHGGCYREGVRKESQIVHDAPIASGTADPSGRQRIKNAWGVVICLFGGFHVASLELVVSKSRGISSLSD
jgi:hypothetical protein